MQLQHETVLSCRTTIVNSTLNCVILCGVDRYNTASSIKHAGTHSGVPSDCLPAFSGLTWQSLAVLQRSCTRD